MHCRQHAWVGQKLKPLCLRNRYLLTENVQICRNKAKICHECEPCIDRDLGAEYHSASSASDEGEDESAREPLDMEVDHVSICILF